MGRQSTLPSLPPRVRVAHAYVGGTVSGPVRVYPQRDSWKLTKECGGRLGARRSDRNKREEQQRPLRGAPRFNLSRSSRLVLASIYLSVPLEISFVRFRARVWKLRRVARASVSTWR